MPSPDAFPSGTYAKYKRATQYFLDWLLRARSCGLGLARDASTPTRPLDVYDEIVAAVATQPSALPPALLQSYPHALEACESAITLRERVTLFLGESADDAHAHFLERLKAWFRSLQEAFPSPAKPKLNEKDRGNAAKGADATTPDRPTKRCDFSNYYDVLDLPEDYFADEQDASQVVTASNVPSLSAAERKRLHDEAFAEDLNTELACFFMELEELSEAVYAAFLEVKKEKKTLLEATTVAKMAIDSAATLIATLHLRYPSIRDAEDLVTLIKDRLSEAEVDRLEKRIMAAWRPSEDPREIRYQYVPGTILVDIVWIVRMLLSFASAVRSCPDRKFTMTKESKEETYDEEQSPWFVVPDWFTTPWFFKQQLPLIHNTLLSVRSKGGRLNPFFLETWFFEPFNELGKNYVVTIHLTFVCICWIRSVSALQRNGGLRRCVGQSLMHLWKLGERLNDSFENGITHQTAEHFETEMKRVLRKVDGLHNFVPLLRQNPILAGCVLFDHQIKFVEIGNDTLMVNSRFRALCHIYSALRDRQLLEEIPFVEDVIRVYEKAVFAPSRASATHEAYTKSYLASVNYLQVSFLATYGRRATPPPEPTNSVYEKTRLVNNSKTFRLLYMKDYSILPVESKTSWKNLLATVSEFCRSDLFDSRVLSRDMLTFSDDLYNLFNSLCDKLGRRPNFERLIESTDRRLTREQAAHRALENAVLFPLLPMLDRYDGNVPAQAPDTSLLVDPFGAALTDRGNEAAYLYGQRAADVFTRHFKYGVGLECESRYYSLPATKDWMTLEFGPVDLDRSVPQFIVSIEFNILLGMLSTHVGPLKGDELEDFKSKVIEMPALVATISAEPDIELCTLLHHAAAGPAHDIRLVEWLIQMGALNVQPRDPSDDDPDLGYFCNCLAVHAAAELGYDKIVKHILDAGYHRDLNTMTVVTHESLMHIAAKHDHGQLIDLLQFLDADVSGVDASGKHVWDVTKNRQLRLRLKKMAAQQNKERHTETTARSKEEEEERSRQLREALERQRDAESSAARARQREGRGGGAGNEKPAIGQLVSETPTSPRNGIGNKSSKKNKKKNKKKKASTAHP